MTYEPQCEECGVKTAKLTKTSDKMVCKDCKPVKMWLPFVEALYMYNAFGVVSSFEYSNETGIMQDYIQDIMPVADKDFSQILMDFKDVKFYINEEWLPFFEHKLGDYIGINDFNFGYNPPLESTQLILLTRTGEGDCESSLEDAKLDKFPIVFRDNKQFFMPTKE